MRGLAGVNPPTQPITGKTLADFDNRLAEAGGNRAKALEKYNATIRKLSTNRSPLLTSDGKMLLMIRRRRLRGLAPVVDVPLHSATPMRSTVEYSVLRTNPSRIPRRAFRRPRSAACRGSLAALPRWQRNARLRSGISASRPVSPPLKAARARSGSASGSTRSALQRSVVASHCCSGRVQARGSAVRSAVCWAALWAALAALPAASSAR